MPRNPADRPATEPRTEAGRKYIDRFIGHGAASQRQRDAILAIEAEAAEGAAPRAEGHEDVYQRGWQDGKAHAEYEATHGEGDSNG